MVRAAFSTDRDLSSYQRDYAATFWINTALCQGGAPNLLQRVAAGPLRMEDMERSFYSPMVRTNLAPTAVTAHTFFRSKS